MIARRSLLAAGAAAVALPAAAAPRAPTTSRIIVTESRIFVPVTIGGVGPFAFILDTGATVSCIAPKLAASLRLSKLGHKRVTGIGGNVDLDFFEAKDVVFGGGVRQAAVLFGGIAPTGSAGLLAAGLFTAHDSDIDFDAGEWRVYPGGRPPRDGWTRLDADITPSHDAGSPMIYVDALLDGRKLRLLLDTGAPPELLLFSRAARRSGLWSDAHPFSPERLHGVGGPAERLGRVVRARRLTLGGFDFDAPLVRLHDPKDMSETGFDGLLGLAVIERLNLSTEVRRASLWAQPSRRPKPPEIYGAAGAWLDRMDGGRALIAVLSPGGPAAAAGLRIGDVLTGIGDWSSFIRRFAGPPGSSVDVNIESGSETTLRTVTLRAYL